jgi:hypothetical protein
MLTARGATVSRCRLDRASLVGYTKASFFVPDGIPSFIGRCAANARFCEKPNFTLPLGRAKPAEH